MDGSFDIRQVRIEDLDALLDLYRHLHPDEAPISPDVAKQRLTALEAMSGSAILLGFEGNTPVSSCTLVVIPNLTRSGRPYALIENVVTDSGSRGHGYGSRMLAEAVRRAKHAGCYKVMLMTGSTNPKTLDFYSGAGFEQSKAGFQIRMSQAASG